jgi:hypothetical protein
MSVSSIFGQIQQAAPSYNRYAPLTLPVGLGPLPLSPKLTHYADKPKSGI